MKDCCCFPFSRWSARKAAPGKQHLDFLFFQMLVSFVLEISHMLRLIYKYFRHGLGALYFYKNLFLVCASKTYGHYIMQYSKLSFMRYQQSILIVSTVEPIMCLFVCFVLVFSLLLVRNVWRTALLQLIILRFMQCCLP